MREHVLLRERRHRRQRQLLRGSVQPLCLGRGHVPLQTRNVLLRLPQAAHPRNGHRALGPAPIQRHLHAPGAVVPRDAVCRRHVAHLIQQPQVRRVLQVCLRQRCAGPLRQVCGGVLAGQQSEPQRRVREDLDAEFIAHLLKSVLVGIGVQKAVLNLVAHQGNPALCQRGVHRADRVLAVVGDPHGLDKPALVALGQAVPIVLIGPGVGEMDLVELDLGLLQSLERGFAGVDDIFGLQSPGQCGELGGHIDVPTAGDSEIPQQLFTPSKAVDLGRIKELHTVIQEVVERLL
mmetsp:Transcript_86523/g.143944  ORF Transcript_86523/g.143944 Transcript_86523/m.143944 type:complete len:291 (-) Transcript_86523:840-1712(-)